jgi:hypothetical protein
VWAWPHFPEALHAKKPEHGLCGDTEPLGNLGRRVAKSKGLDYLFFERVELATLRGSQRHFAGKQEATNSLPGAFELLRKFLESGSRTILVGDGRRVLREPAEYKSSDVTLLRTDATRGCLT